jgi:argininosuccinate lyase
MGKEWTFMGSKEKMIQREGTSFPGKTYAEVVLTPAYNEAKLHLLGPMMEINKAHLIMLTEQKLLAEKDARRIARALCHLDLNQLRTCEYTGEFEDLFFQVEHLLLQDAGEVAGNLHLARSRNDMGIAVYRMTLREKLLTALSSGLDLYENLLSFAKEHTETIMIAHTHTQQAQPTTLAHYVMAAIDVLERDIHRLTASYATCNRSSMGAAALTTSGFAVNRERMRELLAFDGIIENSYDAVAGADYISEIAAAVQIAALNLGRVVQDLLLWSTQEFGVLKVAEPYVQVSSIMPQKRNPVSLEHSRSLLSSCVGNAGTVLTMLHNTPFGDINDTEDDMQPYMWKALSLLDQIYRLLSAVIATAEINKETLRKRAEESFAVVTELADTLVRSENLPFRVAHTIVTRIVKSVHGSGGSVKDITIERVNEAAQAVIGRSLSLHPTELAEALNPYHFVEIRSLPGGPSPQEVRRMIASREQNQIKLREWHTRAEEKCRKAAQYCEQIVHAWSKEE